MTLSSKSSNRNFVVSAWERAHYKAFDSN